MFFVPGASAVDRRSQQVSYRPWLLKTVVDRSCSLLSPQADFEKMKEDGTASTELWSFSMAMRIGAFSDVQAASSCICVHMNRAPHGRMGECA